VHFLYLLPRTACSVSIYLLALHVAVLLNALTPLSCRSLSRLLTCAVNAPYLSSISLHLRGRSFMSSAYPPSTQHVCSHSPRSSWSRCRLFFLSLYCLDFRCHSGHPSHIHPSTPCRNIHMSFIRIPHTVHSIKPRSAFQKSAGTLHRAHITTSLGPCSPLSASSVSLCRRC
jgi:hypothetical protein